jgi:hypothetical protein
MLRDGQFIKEDPPKIGAHYVPKFYQSVGDGNNVIEEESRFGAFMRKNISPFDVGACMVLIYVAIAVVITMVRGFFNLIFG